MFQPIPPVTLSPPAPPVLQDVIGPGGLDVAAGPMPRVSPSEAAGFSDAIRAGKAQEIGRPGPHTGNRVWSDAGRRLGGTLDGLQNQETEVRKLMRDHALAPGAGAGHGGETGNAADPGSLPQDSESLTKWAMEESATLMRENLQTAEFVITADLASNGAKDMTGAVKQLANGGSG